jgi:two-component system OmpR family response regulator
VLIVDDDDGVRDLVRMALRHVGYDVEGVASLLDARNMVERRPPDLMLLDVMLPDGDGFAFCRRVREAGIDVPVLFLTARDTMDDKVRGLTVGGDDYLTKPFGLEELVARIAAILRRGGKAAHAGRLYEYADVVLDDDRHEVSRSGTLVDLSPTEFKLLRYFLANRERALSKAQILDHVWGYEFTGDANVVETYVSYLRRKLDPLGAPLIQTIRGIGYRLRSD